MTFKQTEISESEYIYEGYRKDSFSLWFWLFLLGGLTLLIGIGSRWYQEKMDVLFKDSPFLQVTNREMSLFLWENPEFMRINAKQKNGYLPGFLYLGRVTLDLDQADQYVSAPPELLFRYHTWKRLLSNEFIQRPINPREFAEFLLRVPEWQPQHWPNSPPDYAVLVKNLSKIDEDLTKLSFSSFPKDVRKAFQGWKNFFKEGDAIDHVKFTWKQMKEFLMAFPHYRRNYWCNIVSKNYLIDFKDSDEKEFQEIPSIQMAPFLKVAIYNFTETNPSGTVGASFPIGKVPWKNSL